MGKKMVRAAALLLLCWIVSGCGMLLTGQADREEKPETIVEKPENIAEEPDEDGEERTAPQLLPESEPPAGEDSGLETAAEDAGNIPEAGYAAYMLLDEEERTAYEEILEAEQEHLDQVRLSTLDEDVISAAYEAVCSDWGGLFWASGYTCKKRVLGEKILGLYFEPTYTLSEEERKQCQEAVDRKAESWLSELPEDASDYEKVRYVYEALIRNVDYNLNAEENQNILSVFLAGESVCSGYANAAQYLLTLVDVPCMTIYGYSEGESHAWNLVYIDGETYFLDATWGDTVSTALGGISYSFLNMTSRDIERTHDIDMQLTIPDCTSLDASCFVREGRFFADYDETAMGEALAAGLASGEPFTELKCGTEEVFYALCDTFLTEQRITDYCPSLTRIDYMQNEDQRILTLCW